jgi:hypothetical protein
LLSLFKINLSPAPGGKGIYLIPRPLLPGERGVKICIEFVNAFV